MAAGWSRSSSWPHIGRDSRPLYHMMVDMGDDFAECEEAVEAVPVVEEVAGDALLGASEQGANHCKPCIFFASPLGCSRGVHCRFCHVHSPKRDGPAKRARKTTRDMLKAQVLELLQGKSPEEMQAMQDELQDLVDGNSFARAFAMAYLQGRIPDTQEISEEERARILPAGPVHRTI